MNCPPQHVGLTPLYFIVI